MCSHQFWFGGVKLDPWRGERGKNQDPDDWKTWRGAHEGTSKPAFFVFVLCFVFTFEVHLGWIFSIYYNNGDFIFQLKKQTINLIDHNGLICIAFEIKTWVLALFSYYRKESLHFTSEYISSYQLLSYWAKILTFSSSVPNFILALLLNPSIRFIFFLGRTDCQK